MSVIESFVPVYPDMIGSSSVNEPISSQNFFLVSLKRTEVLPNRENVILLHGWFGSSDDYDLAFEQFSHKYNLFALDLRGHGDSDYPLTLSWSITDLAKDIHSVLNQYLGENYKIKIIASSLSSAVALTFAQLYPQQVEAMLLVSPTTQFSVPLWLRSLAKMSPRKLIKLAATIFEKTTKYLVPKHEQETYYRFIDQLKHQPLDIQKKIIEETLASYNIDPVSIKVPILILAGMEDKVIPFKDTRELNMGLAKSSLIVFEGMQHRLLNKMPEVVLGIAEVFLSNPELFFVKKEFIVPE